MVALYPVQDVFVRGEISPRLHARASLDLYRAALSKCENLITLPHGGIRKRGGTYFAGEVKDSSKRVRLIPFVFSADQAYAIEVGDFYLRVYAYGARVATVEVVTPWPEQVLSELQFYQSADVMWIVHGDYQTRTLTRLAHDSWAIAVHSIEDGPYLVEDTQGTTLKPANTGGVVPVMTDNTSPSGTVSNSYGSADAYKSFTRVAGDWVNAGYTSALMTTTYMLPGGQTAVVDGYSVQAPATVRAASQHPPAWVFEGYDGTNWISLDTRDSETFTAGERKFFNFENTTAFEGFRIRGTATGTGPNGDDASGMGQITFHRSADTQTPFNLVASSTTGINGGDGFKTSDVGRPIRLLGIDNRWRWAEIKSWTSTTIVTIVIHDQALPDTSRISRWRLGAWSGEEGWPDTVTIFEERLVFGKETRINGSKTGAFETFTQGELDDDALEFLQAGGGQQNNIVWLADVDGALAIATAGGIRSLSGAGIDEALTPSSFKNKKSRTHGAARIRPADAAASFLYVTSSRMSIAEMVQNQSGRFSSDDVGQVSEHIPKKGVVNLAYQNDPDPILWFPLDNGEMGGFTHQPSQEVRGMHRHRIGGSFDGSEWGIVESAIVTPGLTGADDVWLIVKRTINGVTKRYIEVMQEAFEYREIETAFQVDCGLSYSGAATNAVTGVSHLEGETVNVLADGKVYKGLSVSAGTVTLPDGATAEQWHVGLGFTCEAATLELDVGGRDGSMMGRRKKISAVILSLFETDVSGLKIQSMQRGRWETVKVPTIVPSDGKAHLFSENVTVLIDDSWTGQGKVRIVHDNPTPCTIRAMTPVFEGSP